jgi:hypothetical protein
MTRYLLTSTDVPAGPPPEVLMQIDVAWERAREMFASDLELHFEVDPRHAHVWAELRQADGSVVERLSATEALALACGDALVPQPLVAA